MKSLFKTLANYFLQGLLYVAPIGLTIYILVFALGFITDITSTWTYVLLGSEIPGIGFLVLLILITLVGWLGGSVIAIPVRRYLDNMLSHVPILKSVYMPIKDIFSAFMGKEKKFTNPVLVKMSNDMELYRIGFVTHKDLSIIGLEHGMISVFIPYSYAIMGSLVIVPSKNITPLDISSADALKFAISGGLTELIKKEKTLNEDDEKETTDISNQ